MPHYSLTELISTVASLSHSGLFVEGTEKLWAKILRMAKKSLTLGAIKILG
jgi:hypothetical protein